MIDLPNNLHQLPPSFMLLFSSIGRSPLPLHDSRFSAILIVPYSTKRMIECLHSNHTTICENGQMARLSLIS